MSKIYVHRLADLPSTIAVPVGDQVGTSQRFNLQMTPVTRRLYTIRVEGPHEPGIYGVEIHALGGDVLRSVPIEVPPGPLQMGVITAELVGPIFGEFVVNVVKIADTQTIAAPSDTPAEAAQ